LVACRARRAKRTSWELEVVSTRLIRAIMIEMERSTGLDHTWAKPSRTSASRARIAEPAGRLAGVAALKLQRIMARHKADTKNEPASTNRRSATGRNATRAPASPGPRICPALFVAMMRALAVTTSCSPTSEGMAANSLQSKMIPSVD
jgi:hypothetical protein